ncbi:hypothetical protein NDU88_006426 [Pleurodeles waltl]|uniref:Uncharacterized protein n=1 Tax=Pleurodeles waltl TaxID=8319 RepID=A0AAV7PLD1_PLEWA|nr:hypothetical protein NDU88_006426 [Pleurodeles waltl]
MRLLVLYYTAHADKYLGSTCSEHPRFLVWKTRELPVGFEKGKALGKLEVQRWLRVGEEILGEVDNTPEEEEVVIVDWTQDEGRGVPRAVASGGPSPETVQIGRALRSFACVQCWGGLVVGFPRLLFDIRWNGGPDGGQLGCVPTPVRYIEGAQPLSLGPPGSGRPERGGRS